MNTSNITRKVLNLFLALHRGSLLRNITAAQKTAAASYDDAVNQRRVIMVERDRLRDHEVLAEKAYADAHRVQTQAEAELATLPYRP